MASTRNGYAASAVVNAASTNIPTTYYNAGSPTSPSFTGTYGVDANGLLEGKTHISIINNTAGDIAVSLYLGQATIASGQGKDDLIVPGNTIISGIALDDVVLTAKMYLRSLTGAPIASGKVYFNVW